MRDIKQNAAECGFAETLVAYVYEEANATDRTAFEVHLRECAVCADEVAALSGISFSINDWKSASFDALQTPSISIPYETKSPAVEIAAANGSWLSAIRDLFTLSPAWSLATASMAVVAVAIGLVVFSMRSPLGTDLVENDRSNKITPAAQSQTPSANTAPGVGPNEIRPETPEKQPELRVEKQPDKPSTRAVRAENNQRSSSVKTDQTRPKDARRAPKTNDERDQAIDAEEEDDSLRLAELFDEIDTD